MAITEAGNKTFETWSGPPTPPYSFPGCMEIHACVLKEGMNDLWMFFFFIFCSSWMIHWLIFFLPSNVDEKYIWNISYGLRSISSHLISKRPKTGKLGLKFVCSLIHWLKIIASKSVVQVDNRGQGTQGAPFKASQGPRMKIEKHKV